MIAYIAIRKDRRTGDEFIHLPSSSQGTPEMAEGAGGIFEDDYPGWGERFPIVRIAKFNCTEVEG